MIKFLISADVCRDSWSRWGWSDAKKYEFILDENSGKTQGRPVKRLNNGCPYHFYDMSPEITEVLKSGKLDKYKVKYFPWETPMGQLELF